MLRKNIVGVVKTQLLSDEKTESVPRLVTPGSSDMKPVVADEKSESSGHQIHESLNDADKVHAYN